MTKKSGITWKTQLSGVTHAVPSLAFSKTGPDVVTVTPTMIECNSTTPSTHRARTKSIPVSRFSDGWGIEARRGADSAMTMVFLLGHRRVGQIGRAHV